jgi:zinc protease
MRTYRPEAIGLALASLWIGVSCATFGSGSDGDVDVSLPYERYELENGLDVILHVDHSDPIAAVVMTFHVGSSREVEGKTGFAHLFEHLFFLDSENLGPGGLDQLMTRVGSSTNGSTTRDRTNYFEVVPVDGLEKTLWAEADKLGFFINTVSDSVVAKEKQIVKNEKRQSVDNRPYGHANFVADRAIYPEGHPYRWQVIGSLADLDSAELADVSEFHEKWYGPNNATLVVAGDIDVDQTKAWIEHYFGEIPARAMPETPEPPAVALDESRLLFHEDNFARLPLLRMTWPGVPSYHPDSYALSVLGDLLTDGKSSPFYEVLVKETEVAPAVSAYSRGSELGGEFVLSVRSFAEKDLDEVKQAIDAAFSRFDDVGVRPEELERVKAGYETDFYGRLSSVLGKAFQLATYNLFAGGPGYFEEDLRRTLDVSADDVVRVYERYVEGRPFAAVSFVPKGSPELALEGSERAEVVEEPIVQGAEAELVTVTRGDELTPSEIDRATEPPYGEPPSLLAPDVWRTELENGVRVLGIVDREVPMVDFQLRLKGGGLLEDPGKRGVANLLAQSMTEGTANRTPEELESAIDMLGASIDVYAESESFVVSGTTMKRNFAATMELVEEVLLEPRYDAEAFELARQRVRNGLRQRAASPNGIAADVFGRLVYGDHVLAGNPSGTLESVDAISLDDLRQYHATNLTPAMASFLVAGDVSSEEVLGSLQGIQSRWQGDAVALPAAPTWDPGRAGLFFVDVPDASQSVLSIGYLALAETDPDYYPATVMNFRLGGGGFASDLTQELRETKGYTYGIGSGFGGSDVPGPFRIRSNVRANVTLEALQLIEDIVEAHGPEFDETDLDATQSFLLRATARAFETRAAKLGLLADMSLLGFPADYVLRREEVVRSMTTERVAELAERYLDLSQMVWLVVGDARTQLERLSELGLGDPVLLDRDGAQIQ